MKPAHGEVMIVPDAEAFAEAGARLFADAVATSDGRCVAGLAGGSTPKALYERLAMEPYRSGVRWSGVDLVLGDERFVAPTDADSNLNMIRTALLDSLDGEAPRLHPVPFDGMTVNTAATAYQRTLQSLYGNATIDPVRPFFDICFLGMGDDGHTASLLPGQNSLLDERQRWVLPVTEGRPEARVTLTFPVLESAKLVVFLVKGEGKRAMLDRILSGTDSEVPASRLHPHGRLLWLADRDAAGRWAD